MKKNFVPFSVIVTGAVGLIFLFSWFVFLAAGTFVSAKEVVSRAIVAQNASKSAPKSAPRAILSLPIPVPANQSQTGPAFVFRVVPETASRRAVAAPIRRLMRHESPVDDSSWARFRALDGDRDVTDKCRWESSNPKVRYLGGETKLDFGAGYGIPWPLGVFAGYETGEAVVAASYQGKTATAKLNVLP